MDDENKKLLTEKKEGVSPPADDGFQAAWLKNDFNVESHLQGVLAVDNLVNRQKEHNEKGLSGTNATVRDTEGTNKQFGMAKSAEQAQAQPLALPVVSENGTMVTDGEARTNPNGSVPGSTRSLSLPMPSSVLLWFSGDTAKLESAVSASSASANLSVGYGPFVFSVSNSSSKSESRTKIKSTATGYK
ncbi:hypothetical protein CHU98_g3894 [Xylaria longipes]|nr:hypothetical protein CHU98_g3894 [Xylaria longipes]